MHAAPRLVRFGDECLEFLEGIDLLGSVRIDQIEAAVNRVTVRVDETRKQALAAKIDARGAGTRCFGLGQVANGKNLIPADGNRFRVGMQGIASENFGIEKDLVLSVKQRRGEKEAEQTPEGSAHGYHPL